MKQDPLVRAMQRDLDKGEALAMHGRKVAKSMKLKVVGVLGILLKAQREGRLRSLKQAMDRLREKAGFYVRADLYSVIIREWEEER